MKPPRLEQIRRHVYALCSKACAGRDAGSIEGREARRYLLEQLRALGLDPITQKVPGSRGVNVFARFGRPGGRVVLLAAHYDHIGTAGWGEAYWGADDNAAAVAVLLELPYMLGELRLDVDVWLAFFDAEEPPHFLTPDMGAMQFVANPPIELERIHLAVVLDLVGHAVGAAHAASSIRNTVFAMGAEKTDHAGAILGNAARNTAGVVVRELDLDVVPPLSDYEPLRRHGVPVLYLTCGRWQHYHEITDTPDRLDYPKLTATAALTCRIALEAALDSCPTSGYHGERTARRATLSALEALTDELCRTDDTAVPLRDQLRALARHSASDQELDDADWARLQTVFRSLERGLSDT